MSQVGRASTSREASAPPRSAAADYDPATIEACKELQEDEILALEAIYEERFHASIDASGRRVLTIHVEIQFQEEREVTVVEEALPEAEAAPRPMSKVQHTQNTSNDSTQSHRSGPNGRRRRGRGQGQAAGTATQPQSKPSSSRDGLQRQEGASLQFDELSSSLPLLQEPSKTLTKPPQAIRVERHAKLLYLLPVELVATLPAAYPTEVGPEVELWSPWLTDDFRSTLMGRLLPLWQHDSSTYLMADELAACISDGALGSSIRLLDRYTIPTDPSCAPTAPRNTLFSKLTTHDRLSRHSTFSSESFDCGICLETKKGARCSKLRNCGHVFCVECLYSFFEINIREGTVKNVCCADQDCVKARDKGNAEKGSVELDELEAIVGKELKDRYKWLVDKQKIESDPTVTYCPREACNAPVQKETDETYERLRICPACGYSFCVYCRRTYHGTKSRCVFSQASSIVDQFVNGTEQDKASLELKYGKNNVRKLVDAYLEEQANAKWIEDNSTRCPDCQLDIERSFGCAHMTCARCACHFCFRCGVRLNARDPYAHYSTPGSSCFNKLFEYQPSDEQMGEVLWQAML